MSPALSRRGLASSAGILMALAAPVAAAEAVRVGLDRIDAEAGVLRGRRVGLVAHAASVTADGRHAVDVLRRRGVEVRRLFAPEHGLRGRSPAGERIPGGVDPATGLPVVSLYGESTAPSSRDLAGLDALVFDLQDAGVRFYSYIGTLILCLDAAAQAGIELVVLDRPNPLGGDLIEGPESDPPEVVRRSLLNLAPGPLVHGLTTGEMARFVNAARTSPARLTVVPMTGWRRPMVWNDTGRAWVPPSPNLRSPEAALAYPGIALLEATNVSEGRGTDAPFLILGAPWMNAEEVLAAVAAPGFSIEPARFTPRAAEAAPEPKYDGQECAGLRVRVTDARAVRPYGLGVALLHAVRRFAREFRWRDDGSALDRLVGTRRVRAALERGEDVGSILKADGAAADGWRGRRRQALLY